MRLGPNNTEMKVELKVKQLMIVNARWNDTVAIDLAHLCGIWSYYYSIFFFGDIIITCLL